MSTQSKTKSTMSNKITDLLEYEDIWRIINVFLTRNDGKELLKHQIESYDLFLEKYVKEIIMESNPLEVTKKIANTTEKIVYTIKFDNISYGKGLPRM